MNRRAFLTGLVASTAIVAAGAVPVTPLPPHVLTFDDVIRAVALLKHKRVRPLTLYGREYYLVIANRSAIPVDPHDVYLRAA